MEAIQSTFFDELGDLLNCIATFAEPICVVGDFNVRLNWAADVHSLDLWIHITVMGLDLRVNRPTHRLGGLLDVVATRSDQLPLRVLTLIYLVIIYCNGTFQLRVCRCHLPLLLSGDCGSHWTLTQDIEQF